MFLQCNRLVKVKEGKRWKEMDLLQVGQNDRICTILEKPRMRVPEVCLEVVSLRPGMPIQFHDGHRECHLVDLCPLTVPRWQSRCQ